MISTRSALFVTTTAVVASFSSIGVGAELVIDSLSNVAGWTSLDTRSNANVNLISPTHDAEIANRIQFVTPPTPSTGALALSTDHNNAKASFGVNGNFGAVTQLTAESFSAEYSYLSTAGKISPLKFGIRSSNYNSIPSPVATRTNEQNWDYILVHLPASPGTNVWKTETLSADTGGWGIYKSSIIGGGSVTIVGKTLDELAADAETDSVLQSIFAGTISSIEFGLGSSQSTSTNYIDYAQISIYNGGDTVNFVPEPAMLGLLGVGAMGLLRRRRA